MTHSAPFSAVFPAVFNVGHVALAILGKIRCTGNASTPPFLRATKKTSKGRCSMRPSPSLASVWGWGWGLLSFEGRGVGGPPCQGKKKTPININNFAGLCRKWVGVKLFMCFPFSWGIRETHKQNSQEISGKGRESPGTVP